jgi:flagellar protein FliO/FliZ
MTWMVVRLLLSLAFVGLVLWFAARVAKKRGLGGTGNGLIEVVARQRMGRSSTVNVVRIGDVVLVVGATEEQVTLLAEVDPETVEAAAREREQPRPARVPAGHPDEDDRFDERSEDDVPAPRGVHRPRSTARPAAAAHAAPSGALAGSVFDKNGWGSFVNQMRERTVRRP